MENKVYRLDQSPGDCVKCDEEMIKLVVTPSARIPELYRFVVQLDEKLHQRDSCGSLVRMVPSQSRGTVFEVRIHPLMLYTFLDKLNNMPEIERVEENTDGISDLDSYPKKFWVLLCKALSSQVGLRNLKETDMVGQELAIA